MSKKKAALLIRVSTELQDYNRQISDLRYEADRDGYEIDEENIYSEKISGFTKIEAREELMRLRSDFQAKGIKMVYCWEVSRIARNPRIVRKIVEEAADMGVCFHINGLGKTLRPDGSEDDQVMMVLNILAQNGKAEAELMKRRFRSGKIEAIKKGGYQGGARMPYGYTTTENKKLILKQPESAVIQQIYTWLIEGLGCKQIAKLLKERGVPSPTGKPEWEESVVAAVVKNPIHKGTRKYLVESANPERNIVAKYAYFENCVPASVTTEIWDAAMEKMHERNSNKARNVKYLFLLDRKIKCGCCGKGYHAKYSSGSASYYMCYNRKFLKRKCTNGGIGIELLESAVWSIIKYDPFFKSLIKESATEKKNIESELKLSKSSLLALEQERKDCATKKERLLRPYVDQIITYEEYKKAVEKEEVRLANLAQKIELLSTEIKIKEDWLKNADELQFHKKLIDEIGSDRLKIAQVLTKIVDRVIINSEVTDYSANRFLLTVFLHGAPHGVSMVFDRKTMQLRYSFFLLAGIKYTPDGILQGDVTETINKFYPEHKKGKLARFPQIQLINVDRVPFSLINIHKNRPDVNVKEAV